MSTKKAAVAAEDVDVKPMQFVAKSEQKRNQIITVGGERIQIDPNGVFTVRTKPAQDRLVQMASEFAPLDGVSRRGRTLADLVEARKKTKAPPAPVVPPKAPAKPAKGAKEFVEAYLKDEKFQKRFNGIADEALKLKWAAQMGYSFTMPELLDAMEAKQGDDADEDAAGDGQVEFRIPGEGEEWPDPDASMPVEFLMAMAEAYQVVDKIPAGADAAAIVEVLVENIYEPDESEIPGAAEPEKKAPKGKGGGKKKSGSTKK